MPLRKEHAVALFPSLFPSLSLSHSLFLSVLPVLSTPRESRTASLNFEEGAKFYDRTRPDAVLERVRRASFDRSPDLGPFE